MSQSNRAIGLLTPPESSPVGFVRHLLRFVLILIPYSTRLIKMDRVGFEPTTSAAVSSLFFSVLVNDMI